jgi:hypothetical protein
MTRLRKRWLALCMRVNELRGNFPVERTFLKVRLIGRSFFHLSLFQHVQSIELWSCSCIGISPIAHVPYMKIRSCLMISDFSCLGAQQHYLYVVDCPGVTARDIEINFTRIPWLKISHARQITRLRLCSDNRLFRSD